MALLGLAGGSVLHAQENTGTSNQDGLKRSEAKRTFFCKRFLPFDSDTIVCENLNSLGGIEKFPQLRCLEIDNSNHFMYTYKGSNRFLEEKVRGIQELNPLSGCRKLNKLTLTGSRVQDISPLAHCPEIQSLSVTHSEIQDLSGIAGLTALRNLNLSANPIKDLRPLAGLSNLKKLILHNTAVKDLGPLADLKQLEVLFMPYAEVEKIGGLRDFEKLRVLDVSGSVIKTWAPLAGGKIWDNLDTLYFGSHRNQDTALPDWGETSNLKFLLIHGSESKSRVRYVDFSGLAKLSKLEELYLHYLKFTDLTPLSGLEQLRYLNIETTLVESLAPLQSCLGLEELVLNGMPLYEEKLFGWADKGMPKVSSDELRPLKAISALGRLPNLKIVTISKFDLAESNELESLQNIEKLRIEGCKLMGLNSIQALVNLKVLELNDNAIINLEPLSKLTQLKKLSLDSNFELEDIRALANLKELEYLSLSTTKVRDIQPLFGLSKLKVIYLNPRGVSEEQLNTLKRNLPGLKINEPY